MENFVRIENNLGDVFHININQIVYYTFAKQECHLYMSNGKEIGISIDEYKSVLESKLEES